MQLREHHTPEEAEAVEHGLQQLEMLHQMAELVDTEQYIVFMQTMLEAEQVIQEEMVEQKELTIQQEEKVLMELVDS